MSNFYLDLETCGFHGVPVLMQYAYDDDEIQLHDIWIRPAYETIEIIEECLAHCVVGFNVVFDWFHMQKFHAMLSMLADKSEWPTNVIDELAFIEPKARDCQCIKPMRVFDVMLHARKGPYQSTMERHDVRIKRVPTVLAYKLAEELNTRIVIKDIYFARKQDPSKRFEVRDRKNDLGLVDPHFKDIVLGFAPSSGLKALAADALGADVIHYDDIEVPSKYRPDEHGYAPFALAFSEPPFWISNERGDDDDLTIKVKNSGITWPGVVEKHIEHWYINERAREYARDDIAYLRDLYHFFGDPPVDDDDSVLTCAIASMRWRGYRVDVPKLKALSKTLTKESKRAPMSPQAAMAYVTQHMSPTEAACMDSTEKSVLEQISNSTIPIEEEITDLEEFFNGQQCNGTESICGPGVHVGIHVGSTSSGDNPPMGQQVVHRDGKLYRIKEVPHPAAKAALEVLQSRQAFYSKGIIDKIIRAGRFHPSTSVIGALSGRMGGAGGDLNAHGITKRNDIRECFLFAWDGESLDGGDYDAFEVRIAIAVYNDEGLTNEILSGKKIHAIFGMFLFPGHTYEQIKASDGADFDMYKKSKSALFSQFYGGDAGTINRRLGIAIEQCERAQQEFARRYPGVGRARQRPIDMFSTMRQQGGIGSKIVWREPSDYMETLFGFRRYFTLENQICRELFTLAENPPKEWQSLRIKVNRSDRIQTAAGATQSALFGAAFGLQGSNVRAAANHEIQGTGAAATKRVQRRVWDLQPAGVNEWIVAPFQVHDELQTPVKIGYSEIVKQRVMETVEQDIRPVIPLVKLDWAIGMANWSEK